MGLLRIEEPGRVTGGGTFAPVESLDMDREGYVVPLGQEMTEVVLHPIG
jgi:hypothetical protein